jgi:hypothetical protein
MRRCRIRRYALCASFGGNDACLETPRDVSGVCDGRNGLGPWARHPDRSDRSPRASRSTPMCGSPRSGSAATEPMPVTPSDATKVPFPEGSKAPFVLPPGASPGVVADQIVACFRVVGTLDRPAAQVFEAVRASLGLDPIDPLVTAGVAHRRRDRPRVAGQARNAYHNSQHICEVVLCSLFLGRQAGLSGARLVRVVVAALVHDFRHDGTTNAGESFRLERLAVAAAGPYLAQAGVASAEIERIAAIVLATEVRAKGVPYARRCFRFTIGRPASRGPAGRCGRAESAAATRDRPGAGRGGGSARGGRSAAVGCLDRRLQHVVSTAPGPREWGCRCRPGREARLSGSTVRGILGLRLLRAEFQSPAAIHRRALSGRMREQRR